jgi:hypothetical protein
MLKRELEALRLRVHGLQETVDRLTSSNASLLTEKVSACWASSDIDMSTIINQYTLDIEELRAKLCESEATCDLLRKRNSGLASASSPRVAMSSRPGTAPVDPTPETESITDLIETAKQEVMNDKKVVESLSMKKEHSEESEDEDLDSQLAGIIEEISTKEKLIEQLEISEQVSFSYMSNIYVCTMHISVA